MGNGARARRARVCEATTNVGWCPSHRWEAHMQSKAGLALRVGSVVALAAALATSADAACKKLAFSVNDFGKDGPTKDAQDLLDKYIAEWTTERGITKFTVGKKDVSCELYLNLIVVDEHTC